MTQSEVTRLLEDIRLSYQAAQRGLSGLAEGVSKHEFITKKMENIEEKRVALIGIVGSERAHDLFTQALDAV